MVKKSWYKTLWRKEKYNQNNIVVSKILQIFGSHPQYSKIDYPTMAKEGYGNFVIYSCLDKIVKASTAIDWKVKRYNAKGEIEEVKNHPAISVIENPNVLQGQSKFLERCIKFYYIAGESFIQKIAAGGKAKELYALRPDRCIITFGKDANNPIQDFTYRAGQDVKIEPDEVLHWKSFNPLDELDGLGRGWSLFSPIAKVTDQLNSIKDWNTSLMQNGARPSGAWVIQEVLGDEEYERAKTAIKSQYQGAKNAGDIMLMEGGAKWEEFSINPKDLDWTEGEKQCIVHICMGLGVDPILIGFNQFSSYNNKVEAKKALYTETVIPLMRELADELGRFLGLADDEWFDFDYTNIPVLQKDMKELYDRVSNANFMTINQKLKEVGKDPIEGGDIVVGSNFIIANGEVLVPMNLVPLGSDNLDLNNNEKKSFEIKQGGVKNKHHIALQYFKNHSLLLELRMEKKISKFFKEQGRRFIRAYKENKDNKIKLTDEEMKRLADEMVNNITDWTKEEQLLHGLLFIEWVDAAKKGIEISNELFSLGLDEKKINIIMNDELIAHLKEYGAEQVTKITNTTKTNLRNTLVEGMKKGESNKELAKRIQSIMGNASDYRANLIAKTEVHNTIMDANYKAFESAGVKKVKWLTSQDERVREAHSSCNGVIVKLGELFPNGLISPKGEIGCRCILVPADY